MQFTNGPEPYVPSQIERRGSAIAHGSGLLIGVPLILLGLLMSLPPGFAYLPCPVIAYYLFARKFRSKRLPWGAFQGMQAAVIHLAIALLALAAALLGDASRSAASLLFMLAFLLFLYSVWGAWDTMLGEDFRYIGIDRLLHRVSQSNLKRRQQQRRRLFRRSHIEDERQNPQ